MFARNSPGLISQGTAAQQGTPPSDATSENPPPASTPTKQTQNYGLYKDGKWYCNCKPRARAKYLTVKKGGPNKDRCFYSCPDKDDGCDFFYWAEEADERAAAQGDSGSAATTTPRPQKDQSILKYLQPRGQSGDPPDQESPTKGGSDVMEIDENASPSRPGNEEMRRDDQQGQAPADRPSTPPVPADRSDPITPIRRPPKRRREDDNDEYSVLDFSPSEEEQVEQILSVASRRSNMSLPATPAETPSRRPDPSSSIPDRPIQPESALATPSTTKTSLGATRQRVLDSNNSLPRNPTTPQQGMPDSPQPQTPNADTAASINADISSIHALLAPHLDEAVSAQFQTHLTRISMKVKSASSQREMLRGALERQGREVVALKGRNKALEDEVRTLREERVKTRGKMLEIYKNT